METKMQTDQSIVKQYDIKSNDLEYHIELGQSKNNSLYLIFSKKGISFFSYETEYTLEQLYLINKNFRIFEKIEDLINSLDSIINKISHLQFFFKIIHFFNSYLGIGLIFCSAHDTRRIAVSEVEFVRHRVAVIRAVEHI